MNFYAADVELVEGIIQHHKAMLGEAVQYMDLLGVEKRAFEDVLAKLMATDMSGRGTPACSSPDLNGGTK
jgi:hypothetical protein